jgi:AbrB family looped-hinge helix DNA binding protein
MEKMIEMSARGVITLPKEVRKRLGLVKGGQLVIRFSDEGVVLCPGIALPVEIYSEERLKEFAREEEKLKDFKLV